MLSRLGMIPSPTQPPATLISLTKQSKRAREVRCNLHCSIASKLWHKTALVPASICQTKCKPARTLPCHAVQLIAVGVPQQHLMSLMHAEEGPKSKRVLVPPVEAAAVKPDLTAATCPSRPDPHERQGYGALRWAACRCTKVALRCSTHACCSHMAGEVTW